MRIAYIAPYQGPGLVKRRPCLRNLSLGGRMKMELIAELLQASSHQVEVLSQGEVIERQFRYYPAFVEPTWFHPDIPVSYSSAFPARFINGLWSSVSTLRAFRTRHRAQPFDAVLIYNLKPPQVACATHAIKQLKLPVVLEYEDDHFLESENNVGASSLSRFYIARARRLLNLLSGCMSGSSALLSQVGRQAPKLVLCGVVGREIEAAGRQSRSARHNWVVFSGTHSKSQGLEQLIEAWKMAQLPDWQLHIAGHGAMTAALQALAGHHPGIVFHGLLGRKENAQLLGAGRIGIVPYEVSQTQGFSFKTIEYLAAGLHVVTTPLVALKSLDPELKAGITCIADNNAATIAASLKESTSNRVYDRTVERCAVEKYGSAAVSQSLALFLEEVVPPKMMPERNGQRAVRGPLERRHE